MSHPVEDVSAIVHDEVQRADVCLVTLTDGTRIELVSGPTVEKLVRKGLSYYHVCYEVEDLEGALAAMEAHGCVRVSGPCAAPLFGGRSVAFVYSPLGLIELLSRQ